MTTLAPPSQSNRLTLPDPTPDAVHHIRQGRTNPLKKDLRRKEPVRSVPHGVEPEPVADAARRRIGRKPIVGTSIVIYAGVAKTHQLLRCCNWRFLLNQRY